MRGIAIISFLFTSALCLNAQKINIWTNYADMSYVNRITASNGDIWASTPGGAFKYHNSDSSFTKLTKADGLNSQALMSCAVDNSGKIWFGSVEGYINVYNPNTRSISKIVDIFNSTQTQKQINNISVSGDSILISFDFGLAIINANTLAFIDTFQKLGSFPALSRVFQTFKSSIIYACTEKGVAVQIPGTQNLSVPESWKNYNITTDNKADSVTKILKYNNMILLSTSNGVFQFSDTTWSPFILTGSPVNDMFVSGSSLFLITKNQVYQYSGTQLTKIYENLALNFNSITVSNDGIIYLATNAGLIQLKNNIAKIIYPDGPGSNTFINMSIDLSGILWVATGKDVTGKGFFKFNGSKWTNYNKQNYPQLPSNAYYNVFAGPDSAVYLSNWGKGVTVFKNNKFQVYNSKNSPLPILYNETDTSHFIPVSDIKTDSKGNIWVLVDEPTGGKLLNVLTTQKNWYSYSFPNLSLGSQKTGPLLIDQNDTKWFATQDGQLGLYYFNENKTFDDLSDDVEGHLSNSDGLLSTTSNILSFAIDINGYFWIGNDNGLNTILDPSRPNATLVSNFGYAVNGQTINCIAVDALNNKWIGTTQGVFVLSSDGTQLLNQYNSVNSPIPDNNITSIAADKKSGIIYIGTNYGLSSLTTSALKPKDSFGKIFIYPNPFILQNGKTNSVTIEGLIQNCSIKIFSISGILIRDLTTPGGRVGNWDGRNNAGSFVASGIYILVAYDQGANSVATSKIAVIRK
jgi:ligand-binding sensor domain-containing protein